MDRSTFIVIVLTNAIAITNTATTVVATTPARAPIAPLSAEEIDVVPAVIEPDTDEVADDAVFGTDRIDRDAHLLLYRIDEPARRVRRGENYRRADEGVAVALGRAVAVGRSDYRIVESESALLVVKGGLEAVMA